MKRSLICNHLNKNIEIPCILLIEPLRRRPGITGRTFLCQECASKHPAESLHEGNLKAVCEDHLEDMTIIHTEDFSKTTP